MTTLLSIVCGCYNEQDNVGPLYERVVAAVAGLTGYDFELILIDNHSTDATVERVMELCRRDPRVKLIVNSRNFGHVRSPYHALMQASGAAAICMASDLQDPPELIPQFVREWEQGAFVVAGVYKHARHHRGLDVLRRLYYRVMSTVSEAKPIEAFTGFGLYDRRVIELIRRIGGPYPYVRGLVSELGLPIRTVPFDKDKRVSGATKSSLLALIDLSLLGLTNMSRSPIRFATLLGACMSALGFLVAAIYLVLKLVYWNSFPIGQAPLLLGIFLFGSVQILIAGLIGEYIASLHQRAQNHPPVVELFRVNMPAARDSDPALGPERRHGDLSCRP